MLSWVGGKSNVEVGGKGWNIMLMWVGVTITIEVVRGTGG